MIHSAVGLIQAATPAAEPNQWLIFLLGSLVTLVVTYFSIRWSDKRSRQLARETGAFDRVDIRIFLFGKELSVPTSPYERELWCFLHSGDVGSVPAIYPLRFQIANAGEKGASGLVATLTTQKGFLAEKESDVVASITPAVIESDTKRGVSDMGQLRQMSYRLPPIGPKSGLNIEEPLALSVTYKRPLEVEATTRDKVPVRIGVNFTYVAVVTISVLSPDVPGVSRTVEILCMPTAFPSKAASMLRADRRASTTEYLSELSFWRRLIARFSRPVNLTYRIVSFEPTQESEADAGTAPAPADSEGAKGTLTTVRTQVLSGVSVP